MGHPAKVAEFAAAEYLSWEAACLEKHEYLRGEVFAMVGGTRKHATISGNLFRALSDHVENTPCRAYISDMKLRIEAADAFFYPDVFVTCDSRDHASELFMTSPVLVAEILSPSTEGFDRGDKFAAYRRIPSLREYLLIDLESRRVELYRLGNDGRWVLNDIDPAGELQLESIDFKREVARLFENV